MDDSPVETEKGLNLYTGWESHIVFIKKDSNNTKKQKKQIENMENNNILFSNTNCF